MPFALSRLLLVAMTCGAALIRRVSVLDLWNQWDSAWYLGIAGHGYHWHLHWGNHHETSLAFFPLYPLLIRLGMAVELPAILAAMLISNLAFAGALLYVYRLTALEWDAEAARRAVWILALFPTAFFTFAPYTEALFLLCAAATLLYARQGRIVPAGLWLAAAILTRSTGFILIPAVLLLVRPPRVRAWPLLLGPAASAAALFLSYLAAENFPLTSLLSAQRAWHRALTFPWTGFVASIDWLRHPGSHNPGEVTENLLQLVVTLIFLLLTAVAWRHVGRATAVYCLGFWLLVLTAPQWLDHYFAPFGSMARFVLALFPLAGWVAARLSPRHYRLLVTAFGASMLGSVGVHLAGGWVG